MRVEEEIDRRIIEAVDKLHEAEREIERLKGEIQKRDETLHAIGKHFPMALIGVTLLEKEAR